jgi:hypothetical protein
MAAACAADHLVSPLNCYLHFTLVLLHAGVLWRQL